jgi:transposase
MIVTGDGDIPLYLKIDSGNIDDKSVFVERLKEFKKQWTFEGICVADSALYTTQEILEEYKDQQSNERGFRFLKDPLFFTSSVSVKKPERVEAIAMIMGVCLLVYNLAQRKLRQELESANASIRNQVKKLTNKPTMRWVFQMFQAVHLVNLNGAEQVSNLTKERQEILNYLGKVCGQYYLIVEDG